MPRDKYRKTVFELAHQPWLHGLPETPYLAARVTFADIAASTAYTRAALYRLWTSQYDFWVDLSRYLAFEIDFSRPEAEMPWNAPPLTSRRLALGQVASDEIDAVLSSRLNIAHQTICDDVRVLIRAGSLGYPDIDGVGPARKTIEATRIGLLGDTVTASLAAIGRELTAPHAEADIAEALWCIADGLSVLNHFVPDLCGARASVDFGQGTQDWSMLALAGRALCLGYSSPRSPRVLPTLARRDHALEGVERPWSDTQLDVLDAAAQIFISSIAEPQAIAEGPNVLGYVTVARVAAFAGVSRRTIYNVWPSRDDMMIDLLDDLLEEYRTTHLEAWKNTGDRGAQLQLATKRATRPPRPSGPVDPLLAFKIEPGNPAHRSAISDTHRGVVGDLAGCIEEYLTSTLRRPVPGVGYEHLALIWLCLVNGGRRLRHTLPTATVSFDVIAEVVLRELTEDI